MPFPPCAKNCIDAHYPITHVNNLLEPKLELKDFFLKVTIVLLHNQPCLIYMVGPVHYIALQEGRIEYLRDWELQANA